jgi:hypothetical protein
MTMPPITITKVDHTHTPRASYPGEAVFRNEEVIVARCVWTRGHHDLGLFALEAGDIFIEYYYPHESFNIFAIYDALGRPKGWYCNITAAVEISACEIRWHDLALDLLITSDGREALLDEDEFEALSPTPAQRAQAQEALATLRCWHRAGHAPFRKS